LYLVAATTTQAQAWDDRLPNVIAVGFGGTAGGVGVQYMRQLRSAPLALGAGLGVLGLAAHVDLTIPGLGLGSPFGGPDEAENSTYVSVGLLGVANRTSDRFGGGELIIEGGTQNWPRVGGDWFFLDAAVGIMVNVWGPPGRSSLGPSLRFQLGYAF
jgi:hypothetical protein